MFSPEAFYFYMIINLYTEMKKTFLLLVVTLSGLFACSEQKQVDKKESLKEVPEEERNSSFESLNKITEVSGEDEDPIIIEYKIKNL